MGKKIIKFVCALVVAVILAVFIYILFLFVTYDRIPDLQTIEVENKMQNAEAFQKNKEYTIISYNIGFGAYSDDYSFFMDGGKYSRAFCKEAVVDNITGAVETVKQYFPDIVLFQEADEDSTRSYHVDETKMIQEAFPKYAYNFACNYHSQYILYPIWEPHGKSNAGIITLSDVKMKSAIRRSLPVSTSIFKIIDLDRCYAVTRFPVENGKELVIFNVHLSAYTYEDDIVINQIKMLLTDMNEELEKGNYIICGGDFNQDMLGNSSEIFHSEKPKENWAEAFPESMLPDNIHRMTEYLSDEDIAGLIPSCRNANAPYDESKSFVTFIDGFLLSDNVSLKEFQTIDTGFRYSDHNPIMMKFELN